MSAELQAPVPSHILRIHSNQISTVSFSLDNERLYSGDSSGQIFITSTRTMRSITSWKAHIDGILGIQEWEQNIITHGRDNKLHVWKRIILPAEVIDSAALLDLPIPTLRYSLDVNAFNFCRFSLMPVPENHGSDGKKLSLLAVPNLVESSLADVWALPSCQRLHAAIGNNGIFEISSQGDGRGLNKTGILMSIHLYNVPHPSTSGRFELRLLAAYEDGRVTLWHNTVIDKETSVEGRGWEAIWSVKKHVESVMAMTVSLDNALALTVSADNLLVRYNLNITDSDAVDVAQANKMKSAGHGSVALRDDGRVCAVGGWDGKIRLYSTKSMKYLGTLSFHSCNCQALAFAHSFIPGSDANYVELEDDDMTDEEKLTRSRWLAAGSHDCRLSTWRLISFQKS